MIIKVKLKPFSEWPCQREGFGGYIASKEQLEKLVGLQIEIDIKRECQDPWRPGRAWHMTRASIQRTHAVGALARHSIMPRKYADEEMIVCEHIIARGSLFAGRVLAGVGYLLKPFRKKQPAAYRDQLTGQMFLHPWNEGWTNFWKGEVLARIGDRGEPLYHVRLLPGWKGSLDGYENEDEYFVTREEIRCGQWLFYDSINEMEADLRKYQPESDPDSEKPRLN